MAKGKRSKRARRRAKRLSRWFVKQGRSKAEQFAKRKLEEGKAIALEKSEAFAKQQLENIKKDPEAILGKIPIVKDLIAPISEAKKIVNSLPDPIKNIGKTFIEKTPIVNDIAKPLMSVFNMLF
jgi:hypothetical protein